jgi:cyclic beta-1,2-glucan synthetase
VFLLRGSHIAREDQFLLEAAAHVVLDSRRGWSSIPHPVADKPAPAAPPRDVAARRASLDFEFRRAERSQTDEAPAAADDGELEYWNGIGGFSNDGREYRIRRTHAAPTPMPWSNIIANPRFGTLVTESGGGYTWAENSRENKLTTWANDPVGDPPAEALYLRDEHSSELWMPLAPPNPTDRPSWVHHGQGYTRTLTSRHDLDLEVLFSIAPEDPVKFVAVTMRNRSRSQRRLSATYYADLVLGVCREQTQMHIVTLIDPATGALLARNAYHAEFPDQVAFLQVLGGNRSCTGDRTEFLGRNGDVRHPAELQRAQLSGRTGAALDPCAAVQTKFTLAPGETAEVVFLLGCGSDSRETERLLERYSTLDSVRSSVRETIDEWEAVLSAVQVETPNRALDLLVNRWLIYQTLSCRVWGRSAFYQVSGAFGFRDQLQDVLALVYSRPDIVREHLLRAAARQYDAGDVQHWWHPPSGRGTRTRFSDDLLWLPFAVAHYVRITGDAAVLDETAPYLHSPPLAVDEHERYELPQHSDEQGTLYKHCLRALERGFRVGEHGLPLMGCGDWNDGMNLVGILGRGESVWVGWFLLVLLDHFVPLMERQRDEELAAHYRERAAELRAALEVHAWDGEWYRRAYFDDGTPLGSQQNDECQIDSIAQSWAVLADADPARTDRALDAVFERLVFPADRLVALFAPPFDQTQLDPGYIKGYLPGIRENGGQYTHAVMWLIQALARKDDGERAAAVFDLVNPVLHADTPRGVETYQVEPYVVAGDVYGVPPHVGRGGWTWYTGSASWMYRAALESILGLELRHGRLRFAPCVPDDWDEFTVTVRVGTSLWRFVVEFHDDAGRATTDSIASVELKDDGGVHDVVVRVGRKGRAAEEPRMDLANAG